MGMYSPIFSGRGVGGEVAKWAEHSLEVQKRNHTKYDEIRLQDVQSIRDNKMYEVRYTFPSRKLISCRS